MEDNPGDVLLVREAIRTSAVQADILIAHDGEQAMRFLGEPKLKPDVILLDLNIPKFSGLEILERHPKDGAPVIVLTSSSNPADKKRVLELGAKEYVEKPMDLFAYITTIRRIIEQWSGGQGAAAE